MLNLFLVAIGGALGAILRYLFVETVIFSNYNKKFTFNLFSNFSFFFPASLPITTILVNIIGCFLMGILHFFFTNYLNLISPQTRLLLATGVLGGFTTFSAFSLDFFRLIGANQINLAFIYIFASVFFSLLAIFIGFYLARLLFL